MPTLERVASRQASLPLVANFTLRTCALIDEEGNTHAVYPVATGGVSPNSTKGVWYICHSTSADRNDILKPGDYLLDLHGRRLGVIRSL